MTDMNPGKIELTRDEYRQIIEALASNKKALEMLCEKIDVIRTELSDKANKSELRELKSDITKQLSSKISTNGYTWIRESLNSLHKRLDDFEETYEKKLEELEDKVDRTSSLSTAVKAWKWVLITYGGLILANFSLLVTVIIRVFQHLK